MELNVRSIIDMRIYESSSAPSRHRGKGKKFKYDEWAEIQYAGQKNDERTNETG